MHAYATLCGPDGLPRDLVHGDLIGRLHTAGLPVDDGRVSEAHAMVSLRGGFAVDGRTVDDVELAAGQRVQLAPDVHVDVHAVHLPDAVLGVEGPGLTRRALPPVCSIVDGPRLLPGWRVNARAHLWSTGDGWSIREGGAQRPLHAGDTLDALRFVDVPLAAAGREPTRQGGVHGALTVVATYDTAHVFRDGRPACALSGLLARVVGELVAVKGPLSWTALAEALWPGVDRHLARQRLDTNLSRMRRHLRAHGVRDDLVRLDGAGQVELFLYPGDQVEDHT